MPFSAPGFWAAKPDTPSLPLTWPRHGGQVPIFYGQRPSGSAHKGWRSLHQFPYLDVPATPQFPFGHSLSYSRFTLSNLRCIPSNVKLGKSIEVSVTVNNDSQVDGEATLFLFVRDVVASVSRPLLELKGVRKIMLAGRQRERYFGSCLPRPWHLLGQVSIQSWSPGGLKSMSDKAPNPLNS
jgi:hypothetical protein